MLSLYPQLAELAGARLAPSDVGFTGVRSAPLCVGVRLGHACAVAACVFASCRARVVRVRTAILKR